TTDKEGAEAASSRTAEPKIARQFWNPLDALLRLRTFEVLRYREFRLLWLGQASTGMGTWMDQVTRGWLIYELTDSAVQFGLVRGIQAIPYLLLSPIAGSAADRYSRKTQVVLAQFVNGLVYAVTALLIFTHAIKPWHVYITALIMAAVQVFQQPARTAMFSHPLPPGHFSHPFGLNAVVFNVARSTGPALAGMLIAISGTGGGYSVPAFFFLFAGILAF